MYSKLLTRTFYLILFIKDFPYKTCSCVAAYSHTFIRDTPKVKEDHMYMEEGMRTVFLQIMVVPNVIKI